jgi:hypothetical protein
MLGGPFHRLRVIHALKIFFLELTIRLLSMEDSFSLIENP